MPQLSHFHIGLFLNFSYLKNENIIINYSPNLCEYCIHKKKLNESWWHSAEKGKSSLNFDKSETIFSLKDVSVYKPCFGLAVIYYFEKDRNTENHTQFQLILKTSRQALSVMTSRVNISCRALVSLANQCKGTGNLQH